MRKRKSLEWLLDTFMDLIRDLVRGDWRAVAFTAAIVLIAAAVFYWTVIRPGRRVIPEDRWVAPDADEVKRLVGPAGRIPPERE